MWLFGSDAAVGVSIGPRNQASVALDLVII